MTAEVAVINRVGVALAADSAVTIGGEGTIKIFQTENKIFELSATKPIGLMIYNNTDFFGVPWELIVKFFREICGDEHHDHLFDWSKRFLEFLKDHFQPKPQMQLEYFESLIRSEFKMISRKFASSVTRMTGTLWGVSDKDKLQKAIDDLQSTLHRMIRFRIDAFSNYGHTTTLNKKDISTFQKRLRPRVNQLLKGFLSGRAPQQNRKKVVRRSRHGNFVLQDWLKSIVWSRFCWLWRQRNLSIP